MARDAMARLAQEILDGLDIDTPAYQAPNAPLQSDATMAQRKAYRNARMRKVETALQSARKTFS